VRRVFTKREQFHWAIITPDVSLLEPATCSRLTDLQQYFMSRTAPRSGERDDRAIIAVGDTIRAQATIMGYPDCFALLGVVLLVADALVALLKKARRVRRRRTLVRPGRVGAAWLGGPGPAGAHIAYDRQH
jgi:DHA2 family multidrug resistance protein